MNFLAHLYLSGEDPGVITGNFMGDSVKGRDLQHLQPSVALGVRLHRAIDHFTDTHPLTGTARERLRTHSGRYAGVALDMIYDHLLASSWPEWHAEPLPRYAQRMYHLLQQHSHLMPPRTRQMLPYVVAGDWLGSYAREEGLARALDGLSRRAREADRLKGAEQVLRTHRLAFEDEFRVFLPALIQHIQPMLHAPA
ncbi:MAG: DUF479 domain-containing protein [Flavobacteriales bacterium]|nr:DUF479 domain-containing protein [Flavobacteriales bacterium]